MIVVYHTKDKVVEVEGIDDSNRMINFPIGTILFNLAIENPDEILVWCALKWQSNLNKDAVKDILHHQKMIVSYNPSTCEFINSNLGFVDSASLLKINKEVSFPTWQMSSNVGAVSAKVLNVLSLTIENKNENFNYLLNSIAKRAISLGLFCKSEPLLLNCTTVETKKNQNNNYILFRFVKQHHSLKWLLILFISFIIYRRKIMLMPFIYSLFFKKRTLNKEFVENIEVQSNKTIADSKEIDVIIPTIGRASYLKNVLYDLRNQTHLPKNVIIVEQNPVADSVSELDFITIEEWPFKIIHVFTHQAGACNARNIALSHVKSDWVFLNDDDNELKENVIGETLEKCFQYGLKAVVNNYPQKNEKSEYNQIHQTSIFGSGCSFIKTEALKNVKFDAKYEFGYGEDFDFGMQLRNQGTDIVYLPEPIILHLKAPMGGFRIKPKFVWDNDKIQPKPSPTVMLNNLVYKTEEQLLGYKTVYYSKLFLRNKFQNPILFFQNTNKSWRSSVYWAQKLKEND